MTELPNFKFIIRKANFNDMPQVFKLTKVSAMQDNTSLAFST